MLRFLFWQPSFKVCLPHSSFHILAHLNISLLSLWTSASQLLVTQEAPPLPDARLGKAQIEAFYAQERKKILASAVTTVAFWLLISLASITKCCIFAFRGCDVVWLQGTMNSYHFGTPK